MSILLEALRKSEKDQRPPEAPNIHTQDQSGSASDSFKTGPLAGLLVLALFISGWFVWQQYQPPEGSYQPPVTLNKDKVSPVAGPAATPEDGGLTGSETSQRVVVADKTGGRPRTPVESFQQTPVADTDKDTTGDRPSEPRMDQQPVSPAEGASADVTAQAGTANSGADADRFRPQEPAPISYWELPDAIRAGVPEIKFSVLVYADDPADRFALINGQRLAEGDEAQSGVVVKEIRRDGIVFSYRLYQFLVEK